jgi:hypothetical protein
MSPASPIRAYLQKYYRPSVTFFAAQELLIDGLLLSSIPVIALITSERYCSSLWEQ